MCDEELELTELITLLGVFSRSILKPQTNKVSVKLSLYGRILRKFTEENEVIWINGMKGIVVKHPVYAQMFEDTGNIVKMENDNGSLFVSTEFCEKITKEIRKVSKDHIDCFLSGMVNMPVELAGDLICGPFGKSIITQYCVSVLKAKENLQQKSKSVSNFVKIREVILGMKERIDPKQKHLKTHINETLSIFNSKGNQTHNKINNPSTKNPQTNGLRREPGNLP
jgi:hypothetical protein